MAKPPGAAPPPPPVLSEHESEALHNLLFENSYDPQYVVDLEAKRFLIVNDAFARLTGYTRQELTSSSLDPFSLVVPEERQEVMARRGQLDSAPAEAYPMRIRRRDGEIRKLEISGQRLSVGGRTLTLGSARDVTERTAAETRLKESEERFRQLFEATTEGIVVHQNGRILFANRNLAEIMGYEVAELIGKPVEDLVAPDSRELVARKVREASGEPYEFNGLKKDGTSVPMRSSGKNMPYEGRTVRVAALRDLTERKRMEASLERQVRLEKKKTLEAFQANVRIFQLTEKVRAAYQAISQLAQNRKGEDLLGAAVRLLCDPAGLDYREAAVWVLRDGRIELGASHPERQAEGVLAGADHPLARALCGEAEAAPDPMRLLLPLQGQSGPAGVLEVCFHSVEEARSWQENILRTLANALALMFDNLNLYEVVRRQSITDALTGLHNRRHFDEKLAVETERAVRYKRSMALILLDLDDFKRINDDPRYGHPQGDSVLRELGALLRKQSRQIDIVCRYGGEEFGLILPETSLENAALHAERLRVAMEGKAFSNLREPEHPLTVTASFGVSAVDEGHLTPAAVLLAADQACYAAKRAGKNKVRTHVQG